MSSYLRDTTLAKQIELLGGNLDRFKAMADLTKEDKTWDDLVQHFKDTGEILPDLITLYEKWGGSMDKLNEAAALPGLHQSLDFITELKDELGKLAPQLTPAQKLLNGQWDQDVIDALTKAGLDPEKFKAISGIGNLSGRDDAVSKFQSTGKLIPGGVSEKVAMLITGHRSRSVFDRYNITSDEDLIDAVEKVSAHVTKLAEKDAKRRDEAARFKGATSQSCSPVVK
jgi:hypothetical protein